jgi:hypothetical protein
MKLIKMKNLLLLFGLIVIGVSSCRQDQTTVRIEKTDSIPTCKTNVQFNASQDLVSSGKSYGRAAVGEKVARILFVVDNDLYLALGSNAAACTTYVQNEVAKSLLPFAAIPVRYKIAGIKILTTTSPYPLNIAQTLINFNNDYLNEPNVDAKGLLTTKWFGGIAWIGGINSSKSNTFVCQVFPQSTYYNSFTIAHELGHLYGSIHTHDCWLWPNGQRRQIDSCFAGCGSTLTKFNPVGTVMSYCYNRGAIKQPLEFHFLCADTIRKTLARNTSIPIEGTVTPPTPTPISRVITYSGIAYQPNSITSNPINSTDGNLSTRWLTSGQSIITFTYNQSVTIKSISLQSGFNGGSANQTLTLKVDGLSVPINYVQNVNFNSTINLSGKVFQFTTTGTGNISRILEININ